MVTTIKEYEEFKRMWEGSDYLGTGYLFLPAELQRAKDGSLFKPLRDYMKEVESNGSEIFYYCADNVKGKDIIFLSKNVTAIHIISGMLDYIYEGNQPIRVKSNKHGHDDGISNSATCCPYFG